MKSSRLRRLLARSLFLTAAAVLAAAGTANAQPASLMAKVVVIGVSGLTWSDVKASPELTALVNQSNVGSITVKTAARTPVRSTAG